MSGSSSGWISESKMPISSASSQVRGFGIGFLVSRLGFGYRLRTFKPKARWLKPEARLSDVLPKYNFDSRPGSQPQLFPASRSAPDIRDESLTVNRQPC